jgi:phage repressor protein C with HTH and peptisase S24 domain
MKLTHKHFWHGIDGIAKKHGLSRSGLAKKAGLDATCFNRSKQRDPKTGRPRWPSSESIAKALHATGESMRTFVRMMER